MKKKYKIAIPATLALLLIFVPAFGIFVTASAIVLWMAFYLMHGAKPDRRSILCIIGGVLISNILLAIYTHFQNFIPFWDYAGYYVETLRGGTLLNTNVPQFLKELYQTMLESDYTKLPTLFTAPMLKLLGGSYTAYIFVIYNVFLVPFFCIFAVLVQEIDRRMVPLIFLFTPFVSPALRGYLDGAGLLYVSVWLYTVYKRKFQKITLRHDLVLGLFSVLLLFTRRWYLFFLTAAFLALFLSGCIRKLYDKTYKLRPLFINLLITGGTMLMITVIFFFPYVRRLLTNTMADAYAAYMFGGFWWNVGYFIRYYGILLMLFFLCGIFGLRNVRFRQFTIFLLLQICIMFFLFTRIQTISYHHQYLFAAELFLLGVIGMTSFPKYTRYVRAAWAVLLAVSFLYTYIPVFDSYTSYALTNKRFVPKRMDTAGIIRLRDELNARTNEDGGNVYILASSEVLNDSILQNSLLPEKEDAVENLLGTSHVDRRDGFPNHFLICRYIVVAEPVQVHLGEENQQIVAYLANEVLDGTYTPNLERIETVKITDTVKAHIYRRNSGYTTEFLDRTKAHFAALYPEHPDLYDIDYIWSQN